MIRDKEEVNKIIEACPLGQQLSMFYRAMEFLARQNNSIAFKMIEDACPEDLKTEILADALANYTQNKQDNELHMIKAMNASEVKEGMLARQWRIVT